MRSRTDSSSLNRDLQSLRDRVSKLERGGGGKGAPSTTTVVQSVGTGGGGDASTLDGYDSLAFPRKAENALIKGTWSFDRNPVIEGYTNWHAGNDGAGSGLDADRLDGYDSLDFPRKAENATITGAWIFKDGLDILPASGHNTHFAYGANADFYLSFGGLGRIRQYNGTSFTTIADFTASDITLEKATTVNSILTIADEGLSLNRSTGAGYIVWKDGGTLSKWVLLRDGGDGALELYPVGNTGTEAVFRIQQNYNTAAQFWVEADTGFVGVTSEIGSTDFTNGAFGVGWKIWEAADGQSYGELDNLRVRGTLRAHVFQKDIVRVMNSFFAFTSGTALTEDVTTPATTGTNFTIYVKLSVFEAGDLLRVKDIHDDGSLMVSDVRLTVVDYANKDANGNPITTTRNGQEVWAYTVTLNQGTSVTLRSEMTIGRMGSTSNSDRNGLVYVDGEQQFIDFYDGVNSWTAFQDVSKLLMRLGNLSGSYGYSSVVNGPYGFAAGKPDAENLTIDPNNGVRFRSGSTVLGYVQGSSLSLASGRFSYDGSTDTAKISDWTITSTVLKNTGTWGTIAIGRSLSTEENNNGVPFVGVGFWDADNLPVFRIREANTANGANLIQMRGKRAGSDNIWGVESIVDGSSLFSLGSTNRIANWSFKRGYLYDKNVYIGNNLSALGSAVYNSAIVIGNWNDGTLPIVRIGGGTNKYVQLLISGTSWGLEGYDGGYKFQLGSTNKIAGWEIELEQLRHGNTSANTSTEFHVRVRQAASVVGGNIYQHDLTSLRGFHAQWHKSGNAGSMVFGEILSDANGNPNRTMASGWLGIQAMRWDSDTPYFQLAFDATSASGGFKAVNLIAGWSFDQSKIWSGNTELNATTGLNLTSTSSFTEDAAITWTGGFRLHDSTSGSGYIESPSGSIRIRAGYDSAAATWGNNRIHLTAGLNFDTSKDNGWWQIAGLLTSAPATANHVWRDSSGYLRITSSTSDARLKDNISRTEGALGKLRRLGVYEFTWSDRAGERGHATAGERDCGLIAQEVMEVFPELVGQDGEGYLTFNKLDLFPYALAAQLEHYEITKSHEQRIAELEAEVATLRNRLS